MYDNLHGFVAGMSPLTTPATVTQIFLQKKKVEYILLNLL
jgi:hypothetical protein